MELRNSISLEIELNKIEINACETDRENESN